MYHLLVWFDHYTDLIESFVAAQAVLAPLLLLFLEESGIPILVPGDAILAYAGYQVAQSHHASLAVAFFVALVSVLAGSSVLYYLSSHWGQFVITKLGRFVFLEEKQITRAERLFKRFGPLTIIFGRHIPGMRVPITIFAATSRIRYWVFLASTFVSTVFWILLYLVLGHHFSTDINTALRRGTGLTVGLIVGLIVIVVALHVIGRYRHRSAR
jgi:membrane protein DedA with SNARE-associated domain